MVELYNELKTKFCSDKLYWAEVGKVYVNYGPMSSRQTMFFLLTASRFLLFALLALE